MNADKRLLFGTKNAAKLAKMRWVVAGLDLETVEPKDVGLNVAVEEEGSNHREVAELKAITWSKAFNGLAMSADGGIEIPSLGPDWYAMVTSHAGGSTDDVELARHLLALLEGKRGVARTVRWIEALAIAEHGELRASWESQGRPGLLAESLDERDFRRGFWIASLWIVPEVGRLLRDLSPSEIEQVDAAWRPLKTQARSYFAALQRMPTAK